MLFFDEPQYLSPENLITILVLAGGLLFAVCFFQGFAIYRLAKKSNVKYPALAFIPLFWDYMLGKISGKFKFYGLKFKNPEIWVMVFGFINFWFNCMLYALMISDMFYLESDFLVILSNIYFYAQFPAFVITVIYLIILGNIYYNVYIKFTPLNAKMNTVLSFFLAPLFLFIAGANPPIHKAFEQQAANKNPNDPFGGLAQASEREKAKDPFDGLGL